MTDLVASVLCIVAAAIVVILAIDVLLSIALGLFPPQD
jgi:hypothetical protein